MARFFHPMAFCMIHGVSPADIFRMTSGATANFINCACNCPVCGAQSEIIPGRYEAKADRLNLLIDPRISPAALVAIRNLAIAASLGHISIAEAKKEAEKIHPKAGKLFDIANWSDQAKATFYAAIIGAAAVISAARIATSPNQTVNVRTPVIERIIERKKDNPLASTSLSSIEQIPIPVPRPKRLR